MAEDGMTEVPGRDTAQKKPKGVFVGGWIPLP